MEKVLALLLFAFLGTALCAPETAEHGSHGAEKHKPLHFKGGKHNAVYDYEALLGSRDHDELGDLPDDQRRKALTTLAKSHDANNNGVIEPIELNEWILHSFKMLDHQEAEERRQEDDENEDGKVSFPEILRKQYGYAQEDIDAMEKTGSVEKPEDEDTGMQEMVLEDKKRFQAADLDKDGLLDAGEYVAFSHPYDYSHMHDVEMERTMKEMDEDSDGFISMKEFVRADPDDEESRLSEVTNFEELDTDKDGKLTSLELKPWAVFDNTESAKEEADHLIKECDENEDGHLSIEEIVKKEEDFISSQATDFGRHLHFVKVKDEL